MKQAKGLLVLCFILYVGVSLAETVYQTQNAPFGVDWTSPTLWSNGQAPSSEHDYVSEGFLLRVHGSKPVFAGRSLTFRGDASNGLGMKTADMVTTVTNLVVDGARIDVSSVGHMTLAGDLSVGAGGLYSYAGGDLARSITFASLVSGTGPIYIGLPGFASPSGGRTFSNPDNTWRGDLTFLCDSVASFGYDLIGDSFIFGEADAPLGTLDLDGRAITFDDLTIGGEVYAPGVYTSTNLPSRLQGEGTLSILSLPPQEIVLTSLDEAGMLSWSTTAAGEWSYRVEWAPTPGGPWTNSWGHLDGIISTQTVHEVAVPRFFRVVGVPEE